jgi:hypothetical protein
MIVDPAVSRRKFAREVKAAREYSPFQRQGVWILRAEYPVVFVVLLINKPFPVVPGVLCGLHIDFSDYDVRPPSVRIVNPFDESPVNFADSWKFPRAMATVDPESGQTAPEMQVLLQAFDPEKPFLCLPGVREYHESSAHTGDSWFLHRKQNMLVHLLTILHRYGPNAAACQFQIKTVLATKIIS